MPEPTTRGHATSISVYPSPVHPGVWNYHAFGPRGGIMSTATSEQEAWEKARAECHLFDA